MIGAIAPIMWPHVIPFIPTLNIHSNTNKAFKKSRLVIQAYNNLEKALVLTQSLTII
jgi:hypothetical protein